MEKPQITDYITVQSFFPSPRVPEFEPRCCPTLELSKLRCSCIASSWSSCSWVFLSICLSGYSPAEGPGRFEFFWVCVFRRFSAALRAFSRIAFWRPIQLWSSAKRCRRQKTLSQSLHLIGTSSFFLQPFLLQRLLDLGFFGFLHPESICREIASSGFRLPSKNDTVWSQIGQVGSWNWLADSSCSGVAFWHLWALYW